MYHDFFVFFSKKYFRYNYVIEGSSLRFNNISPPKNVFIYFILENITTKFTIMYDVTLEEFKISS